ncbi:hypothetical protein SAMN05421736_103100 [Evansella caseinilytica]|uniref:Uncharacterized protein n=1 Tax=Evansella caseinilytica TaxID=1503961 RepID=A0A1H3M2W1_9BACI|nr:hypothetical protein [Evansella caseinilytica]SDY71052.1 hypothetical protein SAMN05421736_103100 [Evansella caseinilytica]
MIYILLISFILHLISFYFIILLFQRQGARQPVDNEKTLKDMEDLLVSYTAEMKENNERLVRMISKQAKEYPVIKKPDMLIMENSGNSSDDPVIQENILAKNTEKEPLVVPTKAAESADDPQEPVTEEEKYAAYSPPVPEAEAEMEASSTSGVLDLHRQGYSTKEIAKKLKMGAGEVELLLKFYK